MNFSNSIATLVVYFLLPLSFQVAFGADKPLNPNRPQLNELITEGESELTEFIFPYMITQTGRTSDKSVEQLETGLKAYLMSGALDIRGNFGTQGVEVEALTNDKLPLPKKVKTGGQLSGIQKCNVKYCKMKFHTGTEKAVMGRAKKSEKLMFYHQLVVDRVKRYLQNRELRGYEKRRSNTGHMKKMIRTANFLKKDYPLVNGFLENYLVSRKEVGADEYKPVNSFLRQDVVDLKMDRMQPIQRVSEVLEFKEKDRTLFFEVHIYTNHFFDSSSRIYEVYRLKNNKSAVVITDVMEIDELTGSSFVRALYMGRMYRAVETYQADEFKKIGL